MRTLDIFTQQSMISTSSLLSWKNEVLIGVSLVADQQRAISAIAVEAECHVVLT
jgi:hypothetical protein